MRLPCLLLLALLLFALTACALPSSSPHSPSSSLALRDNRNARHSPVGMVKTVAVDESVMSYTRESRFDIVRVSVPLTSQSLPQGTEEKHKSFLPAGDYTKQYEVDHLSFYATVYSDEENPPHCGDYWVSEIVHKKTDNRLYLMTRAGQCGGWDKGFALLENVRGKSEYDPRYSLDYDGSGRGGLFFLFSHGLNRDPVIHELEDGNIFRFQGGEVEILAHDDKSLTFKVLKPMDMIWE